MAGYPKPAAGSKAEKKKRKREAGDLGHQEQQPQQPQQLSKRKKTGRNQTEASGQSSAVNGISSALVRREERYDGILSMATVHEKEHVRNEVRKEVRKAVVGVDLGAALAMTVESVDVTVGDAQESWTISQPMGGRLSNIDPILTDDDRFLILLSNTCVQVYSTEDSLLVRRIPIPLDRSPQPGSAPPSIVAVRPSKASPNIIWVACSDGIVFMTDWTSSSGRPREFRTRSGTCISMTILLFESGRKRQDILVVAEHTPSSQVDIVAYETDSSKGASPRLLATYPSDHLSMLESPNHGLVFVAASKELIYLSVLQAEHGSPFRHCKCTSYSFDTSDIICSLDVAVQPRVADLPAQPGDKWPQPPVIGIVAGGARGAIYLYQDILLKLDKKFGQISHGERLIARKYHWHQRAVHAVKWSRDGNYLISGGAENVLVLWQLETGRKDTLPNLPGSIENITVSSTGASYIVHTDDNSAMILSTADLKPTSFVSGLQSAVSTTELSKDMLVSRVWQQSDRVRATVPLAINPTEPSKLHLVVGNGLQSSSWGDSPSAPWLQSFDMEIFRAISRHAIARIYSGEASLTSGGHPIVEPRVTHVVFSSDGLWLATVDEWEPAIRELRGTSMTAKKILQQQRREVCLKFWRVSPESGGPFALSARIDSPHTSIGPESVFGLAPKHTTAGFGSLAGDGVARLWRPSIRKQDGVKPKGSDGSDLHKWICSRAIHFGSSFGSEAHLGVSTSPAAGMTGSLTFSDDDSALFVAIGNGGDGMVYVADVHSGQVRHTIQGLWRGTLCRIGFMSPYVVTLSDYLTVYDVVSDDMCLRIELSQLHHDAADKQFTHLAIDPTSRVCAVITPRGSTSVLAVFSPDQSEPHLVRTLDRRVVGLASSPRSSGFVTLDDAAQLRSVSRVADMSGLRVSQPLEDIRLHGSAYEIAEVVIHENGPVGTDGQTAEVDGGAEDVDDDNDDNEQGDQVADDVDMADGEGPHAAVISREQLAHIFDTGSPFAMSPIHDLFYKLASLVAPKRLAGAQL